MKPAILFLLAAVCLVGCEKPAPPPVDVKPSVLTVSLAPAKPPDDMIEKFKAYAKERGLYYQIDCESWEKKEKYLADLCVADCDLLYEEEGAKGMWIGDGATQEAAAEDAISEAESHPIPNHFLHEHGIEYRENKACKRPIKGGPSRERAQ